MAVGGAASVVREDSGGPLCVAQPVSAAASAKAEDSRRDDAAPRTSSFAFIAAPDYEGACSRFPAARNLGDRCIFKNLPQAAREVRTAITTHKQVRIVFPKRRCGPGHGANPFR